jgi:hypothetical protein
MTYMQFLIFSGLVLNLIGTIILAISLSKYLTSLHGAIAIHDMTIKGLIRKDDKVWAAGDMGNLLTKGVSNSRVRTKIGLLLIILGFIIQMVTFFIQTTVAQ